MFWIRFSEYSRGCQKRAPSHSGAQRPAHDGADTALRDGGNRGAECGGLFFPLFEHLGAQRIELPAHSSCSILQLFRVMRMRMQLHLRTAPMSVGKMVRQSIELSEGTIAPPITTKEFAMLKKPLVGMDPSILPSFEI